MPGSTSIVPDCDVGVPAGFRTSDSGRQIPSWLWQALWAAVVVLAAITVYVEFMGAVNDPASDQWLASSIAITHGYRLYYPPESGPVMSAIYAPVTALVYLPAALASSPFGAFGIGAFLTLVLFYSAAFFAVKQAVASIWLRWWQLLAILACMVWLFWPLERVASMIHADAPALASAAVATAFAMRTRHRFSRWENEVLAALFAAISVFAKQNMAPVVIALALWMLVSAGWKSLGLFAVSGIAVTAAMLAAIALFFGGLRAFYFNCIYVPTHQPYDRTLLIPAYAELLVMSAALLFLPLVRLLRRWSEWPGSAREFLLGNRNLVLLLVGALMVPASVAGRMKFGGNENSLAPALYFFMLAALAELARTRSPIGEGMKQVKAAIVLALLFCLLGGLPAVIYAKKARFVNPSQRVFEYCRANPERLYFPQFPLAQLMAQGKLYHLSWGLTDRSMAAVPVSDTHFFAEIPANASVMAIMPWVPMWDQEVEKRFGQPVKMSDEALEGFEFYSINRGSVRQ